MDKSTSTASTNPLDKVMVMPYNKKMQNDLDFEIMQSEVVLKDLQQNLKQQKLKRAEMEKMTDLYDGRIIVIDKNDANLIDKGKFNVFVFGQSIHMI